MSVLNEDTVQLQEIDAALLSEDFISTHLLKVCRSSSKFLILSCSSATLAYNIKLKVKIATDAEFESGVVHIQSQ